MLKCLGLENITCSLRCSLIDCLSRNAKIYQTYENLEQFRKGFLEKNADAKDSYRKTFTSNWIQAILMNCLEAQRQFCDLDYRILAHIVGNPAGQGLASLYVDLHNLVSLPCFCGPCDSVQSC